jgi:hypothetical protein
MNVAEVNENLRFGGGMRSQELGMRMERLGSMVIKELETEG